MPMVKAAFWQQKLQPKHNDVHRGAVCFSGCYDAMLTSKQCQTNYCACLFPLLQIPGQVQEVLFQAKTEKGKKKKERRKKKKNYQKPRLKQTKNCFNIQPRVYYFLNDQSRTRENYIISVITEEKAT